MLDKSWLESVILSEEKNNRVVRCIEVIEEPFTDKNVNYTSVISRIKVRVELGSGATRFVTFIAKTMPDAEGMQQFYDEYRISDVEVFNYEILRQIGEWMREREDHRDTLWCELKGRTDRALVFEDLTAKGYRPYPSKGPLDLAHAEFLLRELARFHAMSVAIVDAEVIDSSTLQPFLILEKNAQDRFFKKGVVSLRDSVKTWGPEWSESVGQLTRILDNFHRVMTKIQRVNEQTLNVISHGDCWKGNALFKYDVALGRLLSMKFVDFQFVPYCSYVFDLIVFLISSVDFDVRQHRLDHILEIYLESLRANLRFYNLKSKKAPTLQNIKETLEFLRPFSLVMMTFYWPFTSNESQIDVSNAFETDRAFFHSEMYTSDKCKRILGNELRQMLGKDVLDDRFELSSQ